MCLGGGASYPDIGPRDTSNEVIVSKYELSDENKRRNLERKRSGSLVSFKEDGVDTTQGDIGDLRENDFINDFFSGFGMGMDKSEPADNKGGNKSSTGEGFGGSQGR